MIVVYISNKIIRVVDGEIAAGQVRVRGMHHIADQGGCIVNGMIMDPEGFTELIRKLWETGSLPKKGVRLVVDSNQFTTKVMDVPIQKPKQMMEFISREFADVERIEDPVFGYFPMPGQMDKKANMQSVFAVMASRKLLLGYREIFANMGISLDSIECARGAALQLAVRLQQFRDRTCILQFVDDMTLINVLMYRGLYVYSSRGRIFSDAGTPEFAGEISYAVSNILQFAKSQNISEPINDVCIGGIGDLDMEYFEESIQRMGTDLKVEKVRLENEITVDGAAGPEEDPGQFAMAVGGLFGLQAGCNLLEQAVRDPGQEALRAKRRKVILPIAVLAAVMLTITGILAGKLFLKTKELKELQAYNGRPDVTEACEKYDALNEEIKAYRVQSSTAQALKERIEAYPKVDSRTEEIVAACAEGLVSAEIRGSTSKDGVITFDTSAKKVEQISRFIELLSEQEIFASVDYTGYRQDSEGKWNVEVNCTMAGRQEGQHDDEADE